MPALHNPLQHISRGYHDTCPRELQRHHQHWRSTDHKPPFADDIDGITGEEDELTELVYNLDTAAAEFGMEISAEKTKIMTHNGTLQR